MDFAGYIPNEHHRVVAHASLDSARDLTLQSEGKAGHKSPGFLPSISQQTITSQNFNYYMPSEQYIKCQSSQVVHESTGNQIFCLLKVFMYPNNLLWVYGALMSGLSCF